MPIYKAQVVFEHDSGLPEDRVTNTFWWDMEVGGAADAELIAEKVARAYAFPTGATTAQIPGNYLSTSITDTGHQVRIYDDVADGNPPIHVEEFALTDRAPQGSMNLPDEVALTLSFRNESVGSVPLRRRRGRIFFGPLRGDPTWMGNTTSPRPPSNLHTALSFLAAELLDPIPGIGAPHWIVYSRTNPVVKSFDVERAWTDDAFDTMRSRGVKPTERFYYPVI